MIGLGHPRGPARALSRCGAAARATRAARPGWRRGAAAAVIVPLLPLSRNSFGWIFTEMGRQPWIVFGLMKTAAGVSPTRHAEVWPR